LGEEEPKKDLLFVGGVYELIFNNAFTADEAQAVKINSQNVTALKCLMLAADIFKVSLYLKQL
jgi:hypothetical protein